MTVNFTADRTLHMRGVALYMYRKAPLLGLDARRAALCGWLHDFGYLDGDNRTHADVAYRLLASVGYADAREIGLHGTAQGLDSRLGVLLNIADMMVDARGVEVGFDARLEDVEARYGRRSEQYRECAKMVENLKGTSEWALLSRQ